MEHTLRSTNVAEILERVLDKGLVIAGDITISIAEIDLLKIKIRLLVASVDKAREIGINWWESDPYLSTTAQKMLPTEERRHGRVPVTARKNPTEEVEPQDKPLAPARANVADERQRHYQRKRVHFNHAP